MHREARFKAATYARAGIPRYWIVDVPGATVIEHTEPAPAGYGAVRELRGNDALDPHVDGITPTTVAALLS